MSDIVERLRVVPVFGLRPPVHGRLRNEAADEIESLRSRLAKLQGGEACCVTHGEGACQLTCVKCNDELRSRLASTQLELTHAANTCADQQRRAENAEAAFEGSCDMNKMILERLAAADALLAEVQSKVFIGCDLVARIDAHLARQP
jgi:hypothetical protein